MCPSFFLLPLSRGELFPEYESWEGKENGMPYKLATGRMTNGLLSV
jgi:hypothetical protein